MSITSIPPIVIATHIFSNLELPELAAVCQVSKLYNKLASSDAVWKILFEKEFGPPQTKVNCTKKQQYKELAADQEIKEIRGRFPNQLLKVFNGILEFRKLPIVEIKKTFTISTQLRDKHPDKKILRIKNALLSPFLAMRLQAKNDTYGNHCQDTFLSVIQPFLKSNSTITISFIVNDESKKVIHPTIEEGSRTVQQIIDGIHPDFSIIEDKL